MPAILPEELVNICEDEKTDVSCFTENHLEKGPGAVFYMKKAPCPFLSGTMCRVYDSRPSGCRDYPHLMQQNIRFKRSFWENYEICPIVFNVIESLKVTLDFLPVLEKEKLRS